MYARVAQFKTVDLLRRRLEELQIEVPLDSRILSADQGSPMASALFIGGFHVGNRWAIHPMEGWDAQSDGSPSELTLRRWRNFGRSGAKLIWGGEAAAVRADGRANPRQTLATPANCSGLAELVGALLSTHKEQFGTTDDLLVGLQLTHSGRFSRPTSAGPQPRIAYHHPLLDSRLGISAADDSTIWTDDDLDRLVDDFVVSAGIARTAGFQFVDVKACHGYLLHELLSARVRPGRFGGDFEGRTRLLTQIISRIRDEYPDLLVGVRLSVFDTVPYVAGPTTGVPGVSAGDLPYLHGFGVNPKNPLEVDLQEPIKLIRMLKDRGVAAVNLSCGSPYYCPHIQRPALFPPSDGYLPPEDPLVGVWRQMDVARRCKAALPDLPMIGSGYSYLQQYVPYVAQAAVRAGWIDSVGLGRMVLSYPELPADTLHRGQFDQKRLCRTFSDCTSGPRNGLVSGCYPLDPFYKLQPDALALKHFKQARRENI